MNELTNEYSTRQQIEMHNRQLLYPRLTKV